MEEQKGRAVGGTEHSWCKAVPGGTGIAILAILTSKLPDPENALRKLQTSHPVLRSRLHYHSSTGTTNTFSFIVSPTPFIRIQKFNLSSTLKILETPKEHSQSISNFQVLLEHELNLNAWVNVNRSSCVNVYDMFFATMYELPNSKWVAVLRLHVSACDRTTAVSLLNELLVLVGEEGGGSVEMALGNEGEVSMGIEDLIPNGKAKKSLWVRGVDMLGYSISSFRLTNLTFKDPRSPRSSQVVRLQLNQNQTEKIISECKARGIKLCGALAGAGLIAAHGSKNRVGKQRKYGIVTFADCRSILNPSLSNHHFGFYHSAILNTHVMKGGDQKLWEVAKKFYMTLANSKESDRHFTDMADLNFLMCKAIDNPALTSSSSLRTSLMSVFEDTVVDNSSDSKKQVGLEDYMGCASVHGIGPSIAIFDTVRDGCLDCVCVYPSPLHSREQMLDFVANMKAVLVDGCE